MPVTDIYTRLAHLELLDGLLSDDERSQRRSIYDELAPGYSDPAEQAYRVFEIVSREATGLAASVSDQRLAQYEILTNATTYATLGRITVDEIRDSRWWGPNWAWSRALAAIDVERPRDVDDMDGLVERVAPQLLRAGADSLVGFYAQVAGRADWLTRLRSRMTNRDSDTSSALATMRLIRERRRLFRYGPGADGHYLQRIQLLANP